MAQVTLDLLFRQKRGALLAAVDATPELKGAGLVTILNGAASLVRRSSHGSGLPTYVVLNVTNEVTDVSWQAKKVARDAAKWLFDRAVTFPGARSSWDAAVQPITRFVNRPDFYTLILPKFVGLGLATAGLVLAVVAIPALGPVAAWSGPQLWLVTASVSSGVVGVGVGVTTLYTQIVRPDIMMWIEKDDYWSTFQLTFEGIGVAAGVAAALSPVKMHLTRMFERLAAQRARIGAEKARELSSIANQIKAMSPDEFAALCQRFKDAPSRRSGVVMSGLRSMRDQADVPLAVRTRSATSPFAQFAARQTQERWVADVRAEFVRILLSRETLAAVAGRPMIEAASASVRNFAADRGNRLWAAGSAAPAEWTGSSSGGLYMLESGIYKWLTGVTVGIAQDPSGVPALGGAY